MRVTIAGVDRSAQYQISELEDISISLLADKGEPGMGQCPVPDLAGTQEPYAGQQFKLDVGGTVIIDGFVGALNRDRSGSAAGTRLVNHHTVADDNALLNGHRAYKWVRPAETDRARILAFNTAFLAHLSLDTTWVLNTNNQTVPAKTYTSETLFSELQDDLGKPTGKTLFIERRRLHWHLPTEGYVADIAIVLPEDADYTDTFTNMSTSPPIRSKDPMDLATDVLAMNSQGATATATDATAVTRHDSDGIRHQVLVSEGAASVAQLQVIADTTILERKAERITYEGEIGPMTAEQVERIPVGCLINVTDKVWGLTSSTQRIASETIRYIHPDLFMVKVECGYPIRVRAKPPITTPPLGHDVDGSLLPPFVPDYSGWACTGPGPTDYAATAGGTRTGIGPPFNSLGNWYHTSTEFITHWGAGGSASDYPLAGQIGNWGNGGVNNCVYSSGGTDYGAGGISNLTTITTIGPGTLTVVTAPAVGLCQNDQNVTLTANRSGTVTTVDSDTQMVGTPLTVTIPDDGYCGHYAQLSSGGQYGFVSATWVGVPSNSPAPGQIVNEPTFIGDGVTTSYTNAYNIPYIGGLVTILVNGLDWTPDLNETDPTTGAYTLDYPPPLGSTVALSYRAA